MAQAEDASKTITRWRAKQKLSLRELASRTNFSSSTIQRWESGEIRPDQDSLRRVLAVLGAPLPEQNLIVSRFEPSPLKHEHSDLLAGEILRAARGRLYLSLDKAALLLEVSTNTLRRWELGERPVASSKVPGIAEALSLTDQEATYLIGSSDYVPERGRTNKELLSELNGLEARYKSGDCSNIDFHFLQLIHTATLCSQTDSTQKETLFQIKTAYVDYLIWWYRRREAFEWVRHLPFRFADQSHLPGWASVVRAHWHFRWERANDEFDVCDYLSHRLPHHCGCPSEAGVTTDLAWRLGLVGRPVQGKRILEDMENWSTEKSGSDDRFHTQITESGLEFQLGHRRRAIDNFPAMSVADMNLRVSATTILGRMLAEIGDRPGAIRALTALRDEVADKRLHHFEDVLTRRIEGGGVYLNRW